jgi:outer membrane protein OmpA-like peptidoglycan-associated protein
MKRGFPLAHPIAVAGVVAAFLLLAPLARAADAVPPNGDPLPTRAGDFTLKLEPGVALPLTAPQSKLFTAGGGLGVKGLWSLNRYLGLGPSVTFIGLPASNANGNGTFGSAWGFGASLLVKRPHDLPDGASFLGISPWADLDAMYVRTGPLNRPGLGLGVGAAVPIGKARKFWIGPFLRYTQVLQGSRAGYDNHDAKILTAGISLEVGPGVDRTRQRDAAPAAEPRAAVETPVSRPDRDGDGVPDDVDRCPDLAGTWADHGCPAAAQAVVPPGTLELREKLFFAWDQAALQEASLPVLDEVVRALKDHPDFHVQVEGHASSEGEDRHNQGLSERRATAVLDYLVAHGITGERLGSKGFASSVPLASNGTAAGREKNRRVEFVVHLNVVNLGSK